MNLRNGVLAVLLASLSFAAAGSNASAQQLDSRLYQVTKAHKLRVCEWPLYYAITFRNPKTGQLEGIDADLSKEFAKDLGVDIEYVDTSFSTFTADLQSGKCEIAMFGVGATMKRAQAVAFSKPYLITSIYAVTRSGSPVKQWSDIDKKGVTVAITLGSYVEPFMRGYLKNATIDAVAPPSSMQAELMSNPGRRHDDGLPDGPEDEERVRDANHLAPREAGGHALRLRRPSGRPDLAQLRQSLRRHDQARRAARQGRRT